MKNVLAALSGKTSFEEMLSIQSFCFLFAKINASEQSCGQRGSKGARCHEVPHFSENDGPKIPGSPTRNICKRKDMRGKRGGLEGLGGSL